MHCVPSVRPPPPARCRSATLCRAVRLTHVRIFPSSRLLSAVLRTSEVESRATRASLTQLLSPQMGKDIVWFLRRWAKTYLLVDEKLYEQVSPRLRRPPAPPIEKENK